MKTESEIHWKEEHEKLHLYCVELEHTRAVLLRVNEELREKIGALERGQLDFQNKLKELEPYDPQFTYCLDSKKWQAHCWKIKGLEIYDSPDFLSCLNTLYAYFKMRF